MSDEAPAPAMPGTAFATQMTELKTYLLELAKGMHESAALAGQQNQPAAIPLQAVAIHLRMACHALDEVVRCAAESTAEGAPS